jgi:hypothetical protein
VFNLTDRFPCCAARRLLSLRRRPEKSGVIETGSPMSAQERFGPLDDLWP